MNPISYTIKFIFKRPFTMFLFSLPVLMLCVFEYNIALPITTRYFQSNNSNVFESFFHLLQFAIKIVSTNGLNMIIILELLLFFLLISLFSAFIISGYLNIIRNYIDNIRIRAYDFFAGVQRYFFKTFLLTLFSILSLTFFKVFIIICSVPSILFSGIASQKGFSFISLFIDIITTIVIILLFIFIRIYLCFWYISSIYNRIPALGVAKKFINQNFPNILKNFIIFDLVFIIFQITILFMFRSLSSSIVISYLLFTVNWVFKTLFFKSFFMYVFIEFKKSI